MKRFSLFFFLVLMHLSVTSGAPIVQSTRPPSLSFISALEHMAKNGYLSNNENQDRLAKTIKSISPAIEKFQRFASINATKNMAELSFVFSVALLQLSVKSGISINESAFSPLVSYMSVLHPMKIQEHQVMYENSSENENQNNSASTNESFFIEPNELSHRSLDMLGAPNQKTPLECGFDKFSPEERDSLERIILSNIAKPHSRGLGSPYGLPEEIEYWPRDTTLFYNIRNTDTRINSIKSADIKSIIATSFEDWSKVTSLKFKLTTSNANTNINIGFLDIKKYTENSSEEKIAFSLFPKRGYLYFEKSKIWTHEIKNGLNLRQVATHEIGHILGLEHSNNKKAVMYPQYSDYDPNFKLYQEDIIRIQKIYGPRR